MRLALAYFVRPSGRDLPAAVRIPVLAQVSLTTLGTPYTQNFDTLAGERVGDMDQQLHHPGLVPCPHRHRHPSSRTTAAATRGNLYSYGTGTATDRALGSLGSGNAAIGNLFWGVRLQNNTGATITSLDISYIGEQWRNSAAAAQTIAFSYLVGQPDSHRISGRVPVGRRGCREPRFHQPDYRRRGRRAQRQSGGQPGDR